mmetsp:Transcript_5682/g.16905  ORF Transcript_5682/g.16905 Transcript_5682/m.16905 type:complete len:223 (+) Transcript_5682:76-744(+)
MVGFVGVGGARLAEVRRAGGAVSGRRRAVVVAKTKRYTPSEAPMLRETVRDAVVYDVSGKKRQLADVVAESDKPTVIAWLRHYGCTLCRKQIADLTELHKRGFENVRLIAIGSGTAKQGADFLKETRFPGEIYSDPERKTYNALNFTQGVLSTFNLPALQKLMGSFIGGNVQRLETVPTDPFQQGGCLVINSDGSIALLHRDEFAGDHVEDTVLKKTLASVR